MMRGKLDRRVLRLAALALGLLAAGGCALFQFNRAPTAAFTAMPETGYAPLDVTFDASASTDPNRDDLTYAWSFGDGATGSGVTATHTYAGTGSYGVILRVTDPDGLDDATMLTIDVPDVPDGHVVLRFAWTSDGTAERLDFAVLWNLYLTFRGKLRTPLVDNYEYGVFVEDPLDDPTLEDLADLLWARADGSALGYAETALAFVQGAIDYRADPSNIEWPLYPVETLVDGEGDCEDTAILYVSLLKARSVSSQLAFVDTDGDGSPDHVLVLVAVPSSFSRPGATVFDLGGTEYAVAETASGEIALGVDPWGLEVGDLIELWPF
jgi:PKD repeat protein